MFDVLCFIVRTVLFDDSITGWKVAAMPYAGNRGLTADAMIHVVHFSHQGRKILSIFQPKHVASPPRRNRVQFKPELAVKADVSCCASFKLLRSFKSVHCGTIQGLF